MPLCVELKCPEVTPSAGRLRCTPTESTCFVRFFWGDYVLLPGVRCCVDTGRPGGAVKQKHTKQGRASTRWGKRRRQRLTGSGPVFPPGAMAAYPLIQGLGGVRVQACCRSRERAVWLSGGKNRDF